MKFDDELLYAIGAWQFGWREDQRKRIELADRLLKAASGIPNEFRSVDGKCFRKRFLHKGELVDIVMRDEKTEGLTSWTTDKAFAERFKGKHREDAVSAAIFEHSPTSEEIILNLPSLWKCPDFIIAAERLKNKGSDEIKALFHFRATQNEIVLDTPLRGSEIIALSGVSSPFDDLCDQAGIAESERDRLFKHLIDTGAYIGEPTYTSRSGAQNAISNTINNMWSRINEIKKEASPAL